MPARRNVAEALACNSDVNSPVNSNFWSTLSGPPTPDENGRLLRYPAVTRLLTLYESVYCRCYATFAVTIFILAPERPRSVCVRVGERPCPSRVLRLIQHLWHSAS